MPDIEEITPEKLMELGRDLSEQIVPLMPPEEVMKHFKLKDRLEGASLEEVLKNYSPEQIQSYLDSLKK